MTERFPTDAELQNAWDEFCDAQALSKKTLNISDGILAGKLYGRFIRMFERASVSRETGNVVRIDRFETGCERRRRVQ